MTHELDKQYSTTQQQIVNKIHDTTTPLATARELEELIKTGVQAEELYDNDVFTQSAYRMIAVLHNSNNPPTPPGTLIENLTRLLIADCIVEPWTCAITLTESRKEDSIDYQIIHIPRIGNAKVETTLIRTIEEPLSTPTADAKVTTYIYEFESRLDKSEI